MHDKLGADQASRKRHRLLKDISGAPNGLQLSAGDNWSRTWRNGTKRGLNALKGGNPVEEDAWAADVIT
jgi:hypothetical protein